MFTGFFVENTLILPIIQKQKVMSIQTLHKFNDAEGSIILAKHIIQVNAVVLT